MNSYIQLKASADVTYKKVKIFFADWVDGGKVQPKTVNRTITGKTTKTIGPSYRVWRGMAKIDFTPEVGYASKADMEALFVNDDPTKHVLNLIDHHGASFTVIPVSDILPIPINPVYDGAAGWYMIQIDLMQQ